MICQNLKEKCIIGHDKPKAVEKHFFLNLGLKEKTKLFYFHGFPYLRKVYGRKYSTIFIKMMQISNLYVY